MAVDEHIVSIFSPNASTDVHVAASVAESSPMYFPWSVTVPYKLSVVVLIEEMGSRVAVKLSK